MTNGLPPSPHRLDRGGDPVAERMASGGPAQAEMWVARTRPSSSRTRTLTRQPTRSSPARWVSPGRNAPRPAAWSWSVRSGATGSKAGRKGPGARSGTRNRAESRLGPPSANRRSRSSRLPVRRRSRRVPRSLPSRGAGGRGLFRFAGPASPGRPGGDGQPGETFGPLLTLIEVADEDAAVEAANATRFGLVGAVHGQDLGRAGRVAGRMTTGLRRVNARPFGLISTLPSEARASPPSARGNRVAPPASSSPQLDHDDPASATWTRVHRDTPSALFADQVNLALLPFTRLKLSANSAPNPISIPHLALPLAQQRNRTYIKPKIVPMPYCLRKRAMGTIVTSR